MTTRLKLMKTIVCGLPFVLLAVVAQSQVALVDDTQPTREINAGTSTTENIPQEIRRLRVKGYINAVAWSADGTRLAALSSFGGTITTWETKTWTLVKEFNRYGGAYSQNSLSFLPDGSLLTATPVGDNLKGSISINAPLTELSYKRLDIFSLIQWNVEAAKPTRYFPDVGYPPTTIPPGVSKTDTFTVSSDGGLIAGIGGSDVLLYETNHGSLLRILKVPSPPTHLSRAMSIVFSPNSGELAVGTADGRVLFFSSSDGALLRSFAVYDDHYSCKALAFSPDGQFIAIGKAKNYDVLEPNEISTTIIRVDNGKKVSSLAGSTWILRNKAEAVTVRTLSWSPEGGVLAVGDDVSLRLWHIDQNAQTLLLNKSISHGAYSVKFSPQGLLAATDNNQVVIYQR